MALRKRRKEALFSSCNRPLPLRSVSLYIIHRTLSSLLSFRRQTLVKPVSFRLPISTRSWGISQDGDGRRYPSLRFARRRRGAARRDICRSGPQPQPRSRETPDPGADEASRRRPRHPAPGADEASRSRSRHPAPVRGTPGFPSSFHPALSLCFHASVGGSRPLPSRSAAGRPTFLSPHVAAFGQRRGPHDHQLDRRGRPGARLARCLDPCMLRLARLLPSGLDRTVASFCPYFSRDYCIINI